MSWLAKSIKSYLTGEEFESMEDRVTRLRSETIEIQANPKDRVQELEDDLARATLLIYVLCEACIQKGVMTREEFETAAAEIDLFDGVADGRLDPAVVRPQSP